LISTLEDDEISEASFYRTEDQREAFRIVRLDANYEPHKANLDLDFTRIKGFALQQKQAKTVEDWKNEKLADTFVKINEGYYDCADELNSWNSNND
jgi:peptidyl-prolyl cis-trans isomerase SurA